MNPTLLAADGLVILVVGHGGREHTIAWKLAQSPRVARIVCAPGNAGTAALGARVENVAIAADDAEGLEAFVRDHAVDLVVVGPAEPISRGLVDHLRAGGVPVFGPTQAQAVLEGSKAFSKAFMRRHGIPTAGYATFTDADEAAAHVRATWTRDGLVVKMDGLADVQSTLVTDDLDAALAEIDRGLRERRYGEAGATVLVEERLVGPEVSLLAFVDGRSWKLLPPAQDHKQLLDGDLGPNTEGMGTFAPALPFGAAHMDAVAREILDATCRGLAAEGIGYQGVLFVGVMLTAAGPRVLEYNCRFGDPETQVVLPALVTDLVDVIEACLEGRLADLALTVDGRHHVCVVAADPAYPEGFTADAPVTGLEAAASVPGVRVVHARTTASPAGPLVAGGRVVNLVAAHDTLEGAREAAYAAAAHVRLAGLPAIYRRDVGARPASAALALQ